MNDRSRPKLYRCICGARKVVPVVGPVVQFVGPLERDQELLTIGVLVCTCASADDAWRKYAASWWSFASHGFDANGSEVAW